MWIRRLIPVLSVCLAASATPAVAQPKGAPKKAPTAPAPAPAKDAGAPAPGSGGAPAPDPGGAKGPGGQEVQMTEDAPPKDLEGKDENPDAPRLVGDPPPVTPGKPAAVVKRTGYPIEEARRPITLPKNMSEVSIGPHAQLSPYRGADALRARYGVTDQVQMGLTYVLGGIYDDPVSGAEKIGFHTGKAVGLDVTVQIKPWLGVRVGLPFYIDPLAVSLTLGAPMKWQFAGGKYAIGVLDDFLTVKLYRFAPSFYQEFNNAVAANGTSEMGNNTIQSRGDVRFSGYGIYQHQPKLAFIGRLGVIIDDFKTTSSTSSSVELGGLRTFIRAGLEYTIRSYLDLGFSIGFDDLGHGGTFGPAGLLAFRI